MEKDRQTAFSREDLIAYPGFLESQYERPFSAEDKERLIEQYRDHRSFAADEREEPDSRNIACCMADDMLKDYPKLRDEFLREDAKQQELADKDNAQPKPRPPIHIQHPRMAPPGSAGIRVDRMPPPANSQSQRPSLDREIGKPSNLHKEFKPLASPSTEKDKGIIR